MLKALSAALFYPMALADQNLDQEYSTKTLGLMRWQPFYQKYIDSKFSSPDNAPDAYSSAVHVCWFHWIVEKPFSTSERFSISVTHNCPSQLIHSISFNLQFDDVSDGTLTTDKNTADYTVTDTAITSIRLFAKTEAGVGASQDFGVWHTSEDGSPLTWDYTYTINYEAPYVVTIVDKHVYVTSDGAGDGNIQNGDNIGQSNTGANYQDYTWAEGEFILPDEFVLAGTVSIFKTEETLKYETIDSRDSSDGCRRITFSNGVEQISTGWLGGDEGCLTPITGSTVRIVEDTPANNFASGEFIEHMRNSIFVEGDQRLVWRQVAITVNGVCFGRCSPKKNTFFQSVTIGEGQSICGLTWHRQDYIKEPESGGKLSTNVSWRPIVCSVSQE